MLPDPRGRRRRRKLQRKMVKIEEGYKTKGRNYRGRVWYSFVA
jgi:hypothetical protein